MYDYNTVQLCFISSFCLFVCFFTPVFCIFSRFCVSFRTISYNNNLEMMMTTMTTTTTTTAIIIIIIRDCSQGHVGGPEQRKAL